MRIGGYAVEIETGKRVAAYWNVCLADWHKWDGYANTDKPVAFPHDVIPRKENDV